MKINESEKKDLIEWLIENGFKESIMNGRSYGYINKELLQVIDFGREQVEAYTLKDGERNNDPILLEKIIKDFRGEIEKANAENPNHHDKNSEMMEAEGENKGDTNIVLMPEKLTKGLLEKYEALSIFEKITIFQKTDIRYIKTRKGYGNKIFSYVDGHYMTQVLNLITGYRWDCHIEKMTETEKEVICQGKIILHFDNEHGYFTIEKSAIGQADKKFSTQDNTLIMIGDTYKAAQTDMIKKAASYLGIACDVYRGEV